MTHEQLSKFEKLLDQWDDRAAILDSEGMKNEAHAIWTCYLQLDNLINQMVDSEFRETKIRKYQS